jgi:predicted CopG family antitoxin
MSTTRPRLTITLTDQVHDTLGKLADLQSRSMSSIVLEYLELIEPINQKILSAMDRAKRIQSESKADLLTDLTSAQEQAEASLLPLLALLDSIGAPKGPPTCNTGVTSSSSPVKPLKQPKTNKTKPVAKRA